MTTRRWLGALSVLLGLQLAALWWTRPLPPPTPTVLFSAPGLYEPSLSRLTLSRGAEPPVVLAREPGGPWMLEAPLLARADQEQVSALIRAFHEPIRATLLVHQEPGPEELEACGLGPTERIRLRAESGDEVALELWFGAEREGGLGYLQTEPDGPILLAPVPRRFRLERPASAWRDRRLVSLEPSTVTGLRSSSQAGRFQFSRSEGVWALAGPAPSPDWRPDQRSLERLLQLLGDLEAMDTVADATADEPLLTLSVERSEGPPIEWRFARPVGGDPRLLLASVSEREELFLMAPALLDQLRRTPEQLEDRQVLRFDPAALLELRYQQQGELLVLRPGPDWARDPRDWVSPSEGFSPSGQDARFMAATLSNLRATARSEADPRSAGTAGSAETLEIELRDGTRSRLLIGRPAPPRQVQVQIEGDPRVFLVGDNLIEGIRRGWR